MSSAFEPEVFGKYFLVDKIATGGMAEIFKAKTYSHGGFTNLLVIKRILAHLGENEDFVNMFIDEAKVSVALQHPNITRIYDFGRILDNYFIAMECVEGKDLRGLLRKLARKRKFLPVEYAVYIAHEVCKGLAYAHEKSDLQGEAYGIVHRDVSPSNVLLSYEGAAKVADFGIAKAESNARITDAGVLKGKFEYMSPEQARGESIDHRSDIFSLGIILHETLTGRRLFKRDNDVQTLEAIKGGDYTAPSTVNGRIPPALDSVVLKALEVDRDNRYQTAAQMQEELAQFMFPTTPDVVRKALSSFLQELFSEEIAEERKRLEQGSTLADQLKEATPESQWDGHTVTTMAPVEEEERSRMPVLLIGAALAALLVAVGAVAVVPLLLRTDPPVAPAEVLPTTGSIDVLVMPAADVMLDGESVGEGGEHAIDDVAPGSHTVRLAAEGHEAVVLTVEVRAGERARIFQTLAPVKGGGTEAPEPAVVKPPPVPSTPVTRPEPVAKAPEVAFSSTPRGATVFVDNRRVGKTPMTWRNGKVGKRYRVRYDKAGYKSRSGELSGLRAGDTSNFGFKLEAAPAAAVKPPPVVTPKPKPQPKPKPVAKAPGLLSVLIIGGGWANVYVDGKKLSSRAPMRGHRLAPGTYRVRVENPTAGIKHTQTVKVSSGKTITVRAKPN